MSNVQLYANGILAYDNRLPSYAMQQILIDEAVNKGGICTISMLPGHPAYDLFPAFRTPVEIYRDNKVRFRGRPLPLSDETYGIRTIICEGELCWLNDATIRPYLYETDPKSIFTDVIEKYNAVVEPWKRFVVGTVTVTDPNDYIRLESTYAQQAYSVVMKLVERCGGYIFFESLADGTRTINWYTEMPYACRQEIALGRNLISYAKESNLSQLATRIIPYGAVMEDGQRLKINVDGKDYIQDDEAVELRGVIEMSEVWDDVTTEENLIIRAGQRLEEAKNMPYSITLYAADLSKQGYDVDAFAVGQRVPAESAPHELSGYYDLTALSEDLCDPRIGTVTFGRATSSLVGADASSKRKTENAIDIAMQEIADQREELKNQEVATTSKITSAIQNSEAVIFTALEEYARTSDLASLRESVSAELSVLAGKVAISVSESREEITSINDTLQAQINEIRMNYDFTADGQYIGKKDSDTMMRLVNDMMQILVSGVPATTVDKSGLTADEANIRTLHLGDYTLALGNDGHLMLT